MDHDAGPPPSDGNVEDAGTSVDRCAVDWKSDAQFTSLRVDDRGASVVSEQGCFADDVSREFDAVHLYSDDHEYRSFVLGARQPAVASVRDRGGPLDEVLSSTITGEVSNLDAIPKVHRRGWQTAEVYPLMKRAEVAHDLHVNRGQLRGRTSTVVWTTQQVGAKDALLAEDFAVVIGTELSVGLEIVGAPSPVEQLGSQATHHGLYFFDPALAVDERRSDVALRFETEMTYPIRVGWDGLWALHVIGWMTEDGWFGSRLLFAPDTRVPIGRPDVVHLVPPEGVFKNAKLFAMRSRWSGALERTVEFFEGNNDTVVFPSDTMPEILTLEMETGSRRVRVLRRLTARAERCVLRLGTEEGRAWAMDFLYDGREVEIVFPEVPDGFDDPVPDWSRLDVECRRFRGWDPQVEERPSVPYDRFLASSLLRRNSG